MLEPMPAGGPYVLEAKGKGNAVRCGNVLVGEVWLCSGQSNMEWPVSYSMNAIEETVAADYPEIRALNVKRNGSFTPLDDLSAEWTVCTPETAGDFSAVAYFYARELHRELGVPVGIINSSWGGTGHRDLDFRGILRAPSGTGADSLCPRTGRAAASQ